MRTWVISEAPPRLLAARDDLDEVIGSRTVVLGLELTKRHETILRGTPAELRAALGEDDVRGEIVIAIAGHDPSAAPPLDTDDPIGVVWREALSAAGGDAREALKRASKATGLKRPDLWRRLGERGLVSRAARTDRR